MFTIKITIINPLPVSKQNKMGPFVYPVIPCWDVLSTPINIGGMLCPPRQIYVGYFVHPGQKTPGMFCPWDVLSYIPFSLPSNDRQSDKLCPVSYVYDQLTLGAFLDLWVPSKDSIPNAKQCKFSQFSAKISQYYGRIPEFLVAVANCCKI